MSLPYPETVSPDSTTDDLFAGYLDGYRAVAMRKLDGLDDEQVRTSVLPSGWTPLELLRHLAAMERRWIQWGFLGLPLEDPWPDRDLSAHRWRVPVEMSADEVRQELTAAASHSREAIRGVDLSTPAAVGGQFESEPTPTLAAILFHVLQEYARHVGQLDVVRELIDGETGE